MMLIVSILLEAAIYIDIEKKKHIFISKSIQAVKTKTNRLAEKYRKYDAYSTWLGYAIAPDYDMCVHTNILRFVDKNRLDWTAVDSATAALFAALVEDRKHISQPGFVAVIMVALYYFYIIFPLDERESKRMDEFFKNLN